MDELTEEGKTAAQQNDMKTLYNSTRQLSGTRVNTNKPVRGSNGTFLSKTSDQLDHWKEHFSSLLNGTPVVNPPQIKEGDDLDINLGPITKAEVVEAIKKIKNGKASDNIPPRVMKGDTEITANIMINLMEDAWEKEEVPTKWKTGYIVKIAKKGDLTNCRNWRGIQLLSLPSKAYTRLILERIRKALDAKLREEQAGFRHRTLSCTDQIATLRIIIEQSLEWQSPLYISSGDFKKGI